MKSQFITNYTDSTFLTTIQANLRSCNAFYFTVSFIKKAGLVLLANDIKSAIERGAKGKLITSTYQNFTDVESLKFFHKLSLAFGNFECHLEDECFYDEKNYTTSGFHTKGYLFEFDERCEVIIGSSNITRYALLKNIEWDLVVNCKKDNEPFNSAFIEFNDLWNKTIKLTQERIDIYAQKLNFAIERWDMDYDLAEQNIKPNYMQRKALKELNRNRAIGINRALIVSATGSGKTYLAAFDALNFAPNKLLYVVHEGSILRKSLETFQIVFGGLKTCGMYSGEAKEIEADFIFSTNVSMCRSLELFDKKEALTEADWEQIQNHPNVGVSILMSINFLSEVVPYINYHKERWDGKGEPEGLKGQSIPLGSRIIALADAYSAMTSDRTYRSALPKEKALEIIQQEAGEKWDPELVKILVELKA